MKVLDNEKARNQIKKYQITSQYLKACSYLE